MTVGRIVGAGLLDRFGRVPVLLSSAVSAVVGLAIVIFAPGAEIALVGVVFWGLGASLGFPVGMSAAADDPKNAAATVSAVAAIGYLAFLVGPPAIGFLADHFGLLNALIAVLVLVALAGFATPAVREPKPDTGTGSRTNANNDTDTRTNANSRANTDTSSRTGTQSERVEESPITKR
ncbi:MFS transporter [Lysinibacter sp. HNR]|uniref:MFS transporter n=1 Tax=Lysinibacter sp. HNR TaxID=3031408 RepID=UPI002435C4BA|nr:MFS transporter [Lysinibacter sp. HNR]WGD38695.1 MFS transporter [Lysinibacter sp. HNR]